MRVIAMLAVIAGAGVAHAQVPDGAPAEAATWFAADALGTVSAPSEGTLERAGLVGVQAALAATRWLEVGGGVDVRGATLTGHQATGSGRGGAGPLRLWIGVGSAGGALAGGVRLVGLAGPRLLDLHDIDGGGPEGAIALQVDGTWAVSEALELAGTVAGSLVWDDVVSPVASAQLDALVGDHAVRPIAGLLVVGSPDTTTAFHLRLGAEIEAGTLRLTPLVIAAPPSDPAGHLLGLSLSIVHDET